MEDISPLLGDNSDAKKAVAVPFDVTYPTLKSLYIELRFGELVLSSGTAFLIAETQSSHSALITNRHNVTGRHQITDKCLDQKNLATPDNMVVHFHANDESVGRWVTVNIPLLDPDGSPTWIEHPTLGAAADLVALNVKWDFEIQKLPYYLKTDHDRSEMALLPADTVSVIGFPFGLSSVLKFPIWATGFLAQELSLVSSENPVFYIDCRTRQGQSGSAVIAYRASGYRRIMNGKPALTLGPDPKWEFLGIYSGRVNSESDLGLVWHVSAVQDVFTAAVEAAKTRQGIIGTVM